MRLVAPLVWPEPTDLNRWIVYDGSGSFLREELVQGSVVEDLVPADEPCVEDVQDSTLFYQQFVESEESNEI